MKGHKQHIKTMEEFQDYCYDRAIDAFACEFDGVSQEVSEKFKLKAESCADLCYSEFQGVFQSQIQVEIEKVLEVFNSKVSYPVNLIIENT